MGALPTGTVTFLFTDIVGSSALWDVYAEGMAATLSRHDAILEQAAENHNGYVFKGVGDGFCVAFHSAGQLTKRLANCLARWSRRPGHEASAESQERSSPSWRPNSTSTIQPPLSHLFFVIHH